MTTPTRERVRLHLSKEDECWVVQYLVDGRPCVPFYVHETTRRKFAHESDFMGYLEHKAEEMLEMYGPSSLRLN